MPGCHNSNVKHAKISIILIGPCTTFYLKTTLIIRPLKFVPMCDVVCYCKNCVVINVGIVATFTCSWEFKFAAWISNHAPLLVMKYINIFCSPSQELKWAILLNPQNQWNKLHTDISPLQCRKFFIWRPLGM